MKKILLPLMLLFLLILETKAQLVANAGADQNVCTGNSITLGGSPTASGGTGPYTFLWTPSTGLSSATASNPLATPTSITYYRLQVTDNLGATKVDSVLIIPKSRPVVYAYANDTLICNPGMVTTFFSQLGNQTAPPYTYAWNFGDGGTATVASPQHVYTSPSYYTVSLSVTDSNGCVGSSQVIGVTVNPIVATTTSVNVSCFGGNNGSITAVATGGAGFNYTYAWSNGTTTPTISNLTAGTYLVTVTSWNGCSATAASVVTQPTLITAATNVTNASSAVATDGSILLSVSGGVAPYSYYWGSGITSQNRTSLSVGIYNVTITDANGCVKIVSAQVSTACANNTLVVSITSQDLSCTHPVDTMTVNVSGGNPPYSTLWSNGAVTSSIILTQAGVYSVYVTDDSGCTKSIVDTLLDLGIHIAVTGTSPVTCNGVNNGLLKVAVTGGTAPYTYLWSNGITADSLTSVPSGLYTLTVTDATLCTATFEYYLNQTSTDWSYYVYVSSTNANCSANGTALANVVGGTSPFSFLWSNSATTPAITGLASGIYSLTVTGSDGCTRAGSVFINTSCYNVIEGNVFNDANGNCLKDSGETAQTSTYVTATGPGSTYYGYSDNTGFYSINIPETGTFTVNVTQNSWNNNCSNVSICGAQTATFPGLGDTAQLNFGIGASNGFDLALHPGWHSANPGFTKDYWVLYFQESQPIYTGPATITFKYDPVLVYQSCNNSGVHDALAHTITWTVSSVPYPIWNWSTVPRAYFTVPANITVGYQLSQEFWITPVVGDCDSSDNHLLVYQPITGSRDPNEKTVEPAGDIHEEDSVLTYTIHFQNTGNDTTWFVLVKDTLSQFVDPASVVNLSSSHDYTSFTVSDQGILTWLFNPIFLVDSATNEAASKGFVMFKVKKKKNLPLTTEIRNTAHIYFDYNEAVVTNTVTNTLTSPNYVFNLSNQAGIEVTASPNPFAQSTQISVQGISGTFSFELFDVNGKLLKKMNNISENRFALDRQNMSAGVYFYSVTSTTKQKAFGRVVVQ